MSQKASGLCTAAVEELPGPGFEFNAGGVNHT